MSYFIRLAFVLVLFVTQLAWAAGGNKQLVGHYYLKGGAHEVGSELLLKDSGKFEWVMMYGMSDYFAEGTWQVTGQVMTLAAATPAEPNFRLFEENELRVRKGAEAGTWVAIVGVPDVGPVEDIEVKFEARSGRTATAISAGNGDAIVKMPVGEVWARAGLRRAGSTLAWQWLPVPAIRAQARIAGFVVTNWKAMRAAPFASITLRVADEGLVIQEDNSGLRGVYVKPL